MKVKVEFAQKNNITFRNDNCKCEAYKLNFHFRGHHQQLTVS